MLPTADPRILLRHQVSEAISDTAEAVRAIHTHLRTAQWRARGAGTNYLHCFCLLAAIRAVELYRHSKDRKEEKARHRSSQRTAERRRASPLSRAPRRPDEWEGSPQIPATNADELSLSHATEWLALVVTGFAYLERPPNDKDFFPQFIGPLVLRLYFKPRSDRQARDILRKQIAKYAYREPPEKYYRFHGLARSPRTSLRQISIAIFEHWKQSVQSERTRSARQKSKPIRV